MHGSLGLSGQVGRRPASGDMGQSERKESGGPSGRLRSLAALLPTVPEIRYLLARLLLRPQSEPALSWRGRPGDEDTKPKPAPLTTAVKIKRNWSTRACPQLGD